MTDMLFDYGAAYNPDRDGTLEGYLKEHNGHTATPLFKGFAMYQHLWDEGYLAPGISYIRIMWNFSRGDEHYLVVGEHLLRGVQAGMHSGKKGNHDARKIVLDNGPPWEALHLSPRPEKRK